MVFFWASIRDDGMRPVAQLVGGPANARDSLRAQALGAVERERDGRLGHAGGFRHVGDARAPRPGSTTSSLVGGPAGARRLRSVADTHASRRGGPLSNGSRAHERPGSSVTGGNAQPDGRPVDPTTARGGGPMRLVTFRPIDSTACRSEASIAWRWCCRAGASCPSARWPHHARQPGRGDRGPGPGDRRGPGSRIRRAPRGDGRQRCRKASMRWPSTRPASGWHRRSLSPARSSASATTTSTTSASRAWSGRHGRSSSRCSATPSLRDGDPIRQPGRHARPGPGGRAGGRHRAARQPGRAREGAGATWPATRSRTT